MTLRNKMQAQREHRSQTNWRRILYPYPRWQGHTSVKSIESRLLVAYQLNSETIAWYISLYIRMYVYIKKIRVEADFTIELGLQLH